MGKNIKFIKVIYVLFILSSLFADEIKYIHIGMLHNWFSSGGCEIEIGRTHKVEDQQDGFEYPALYKWQDMQVAKGLWIGTTNYKDPLVKDSLFEYKVVHIGPRELDETLEIMPQKFKLIGKFEHPEVKVNGLPASSLEDSDQLDGIDRNLKSARMLENVVNTAMGITIKRRIYAYHNSYHDNYFIYDFIFKNTGIYDRDKNRHELSLTDVIFFFQYRWAINKYVTVNGYNWGPTSVSYGHNTVNEILHPDYGDDYRAIYAWHGKHSEYNGNNIGGPNIGSDLIKANGFLGSSQFPGIVTLHADKSASDKSDDPQQFASAPHFSSDDPITWPNDQFDVARMEEEYKAMSKGLPNNTHASLLDYPHNPDWQNADFSSTKNADDFSIGGLSGRSQGIGYGPYNLEPGDSIRIVMAECAASISWQKRMEIGNNWYYKQAPYILPDGSETNNRNEYKDAWVFTGKDSLLQIFDRAISAWNNDLVIDQAPPPPSNFTVTSGGDHIILNWTDNAEGYEHFGGYQLYQQQNNPDPTFKLIHECGSGTGNPVVNTYKDYNVHRGSGYYYYIITYDDGSLNTIDPGRPIKSSPFWTKICIPAYLLREPESDLKSIRIVPNPFNLKADNYQLQGQRSNMLMFYNLPPQCLIKIYTERGDLIKKIYHRDNSGEDSWNMETSTGDKIVSGLYIAYIEVTGDYYKSGYLKLKKGASVCRKFLVIK